MSISNEQFADELLTLVGKHYKIVIQPNLKRNFVTEAKANLETKAKKFSYGQQLPRETKDTETEK